MTEMSRDQKKKVKKEGWSKTGPEDTLKAFKVKSEIYESAKHSKSTLLDINC